MGFTWATLLQDVRMNRNSDHRIDVYAKRTRVREENKGTRSRRQTFLLMYRGREREVKKRNHFYCARWKV